MAGPETGDAWQHLAQLTVVVPASRRTHILDGDHRGGGHRWGTPPTANGRAVTWFPARWRDQDCLNAALQVARSPILARWANRDYAFINAFGEVDRVRLKVRIAPTGAILTAHPMDGDGVHRVKRHEDGRLGTPRLMPYGRNGEVEW